MVKSIEQHTKQSPEQSSEQSPELLQQQSPKESVESAAATASIKSVKSAGTAGPSPCRSAADTAARNTVLVALNHPQGLCFDLDDGRRVRLDGNAAHLRGREKGILPVGAYGLTEIPAADWEAVRAKYGRMSLFASGLLFAAPSTVEAEARVADAASLRHGREPVHPAAVVTRSVDVE